MSNPKWFSDTHVMISTAETCGLNQHGQPLLNEAGIPNDDLLRDAVSLARSGRNASSPSLRFVELSSFDRNVAVPTYYRDESDLPAMEGFEYRSLEDLISDGQIKVITGHGSPSLEGRAASGVPYIKVSDLRAGRVNINANNIATQAIAQKLWKGSSSGLRAYDLISPARASKNIGDFAVLLPGQEQVLLTKEVLVLRPGPKAEFDAFYLLWAMTLQSVRKQWKRIIFMQTNREDVGYRYREIRIPFPTDINTAHQASDAFRQYFKKQEEAQQKLLSYLADTSTPHHFYVAGDIQ